MGVLINRKNINVPQSCFDCLESFEEISGQSTKWCCGITGDYISCEMERDKSCPLVYVPPHGRLIDADAMMDQIDHDTPLSAVFEKTMRRYLNNAPTIIPEEENE